MSEQITAEPIPAWLRRAVLVAIPLCLILGLVFWVASRSDSPQKLSVDSLELANAGNALSHAEEILSELTKREVTSDLGETRCYYSSVAQKDPADNLRPEIVCGPVLFEDSKKDSPWLRVAVEFVSNDEKITVRIDRISDRSTRLTDQESLLRPDRSQPPEDFELAKPKVIG